MKQTYLVMMNASGQGGKFHANVTFTVVAESETNAINEAKKDIPFCKSATLNR